MQSSQNVLRLPDPCGPFPSCADTLHAPVILPPPASMGWKPAFGKPEVSARSVRCSEKGCVFPAASGSSGQCRQHERQSREPVLFSSHQPTHVVMERSRFSVPGDEIEAAPSRTRDRRRLVALREAFLEE